MKGRYFKPILQFLAAVSLSCCAVGGFAAKTVTPIQMNITVQNNGDETLTGSETIQWGTLSPTPSTLAPKSETTPPFTAAADQNQINNNGENNATGTITYTTESGFSCTINYSAKAVFDYNGNYNYTYDVTTKVNSTSGSWSCVGGGNSSNVLVTFQN